MKYIFLTERLTHKTTKKVSIAKEKFQFKFNTLQGNIYIWQWAIQASKLNFFLNFGVF